MFVFVSILRSGRICVGTTNLVLRWPDKSRAAIWKKNIITPFRVSWRRRVSNIFMSSLLLAENPEKGMLIYTRKDSCSRTGLRCRNRFELHARSSDEYPWEKYEFCHSPDFKWLEVRESRSLYVNIYIFV